MPSFQNCSQASNRSLISIDMNWTNAAAILGLFGIGTVVGAYFQSLFQHRQSLKKDVHDLKRARYGSTLIQMLSLLDPEGSLEKLTERRPDLASVEDLRQELRVEMLNALLFASDRVISALARFNADPTYHSYFEVVAAMRQNLWGKATGITAEDLHFLSEPPAPPERR